jgi:Domain of unknown function (DUF4357)
MTTHAGRSIQIYLPTGVPRGIRVADLTTRTVQATLIPQSQLKAASDRPELDQVAVYFLFGETDEQAKSEAYIGQSEDVRTRLNRHSSEKEFWHTAIVVTSKTQAFTPAHIRWLEWYCHQRATEIGRFQLDNTQNPRQPFVTEPLRADCLDAFENIGILLTALSYPLFEERILPTQQDWFTCTGPDASGTGALTDEGFLVRKGSLCRVEIAKSGVTQVESLRQRLIQSGVMQTHSESQCIFAEDYVFNSPSSAACVVLARSANGWQEWKDASGRTLHAVKREDAQSDPHGET